ncbi:MAG: MSHA biogenesis protein MshK [Burkholderiales bacterium]|nr:MSHA biogenesis protein MshK [Burkholderiales bacterium]
MAHHLTPVTMALALAASVHGAWAETLPDPTRPPAFLFAPADGDGPPAEASGGLVLQSVLIAPNRRSAIIGGRTLSVGDRLGDFTLVRVSEGEVQLRGPEGARTLKLFPAVTKRVAHGGDTTVDGPDAAARSTRGTQ